MRALRAFDRDIFAERAAAVLRRTKSISATCQELDIQRPALYQIALDYDLPWSAYASVSSAWPKRDDPGHAGNDNHRWMLSNYRRAKRAAAALVGDRTRHMPKAVPDAPMSEGEQSWQTPAPAPYDDAGSVVVPANASRRILDEVCEKHGASYGELIGTIRSRYIVLARQEACYRLRVERLLSWSQIGRLIGGKDHTTALHSYRVHKARLEA